MAAVKESAELIAHGYDVAIISNYDENGNNIRGEQLWVNGIGIVNSFEHNEDKTIDAVIVHQLSAIDIAVEISDMYDCPLIGRIHIDYNKLLSLPRKLKCSEDDILDRMSPAVTKDKYKLFLSSCNVLVGVERDSPTIFVKDKYCYFPPTIGVSTNNFFASSTKIERKLDKKVKSIVVGGRLNDPAKGFDRVVELAHLCEKNNIALSVIGSVSLHQKLILNNYSCVSIHNWVDCEDKYIELLRKSDVFVVTSHYESFGLMTIEALLHGLMIISCKQGFIKYFEELIPDNYFINEKLSPNQFAHAVIDSIRLINCDHEMHQKEFSVYSGKILSKIASFNAKSYINLLNEIIVVNNQCADKII